MVARDRNRALGDQRFTYRHCGACASWWLSDPPADLGAFYAGDYHDRQDARSAAVARPKLAVVGRPSTPGSRMVEIGASNGAFAALARDTGYEVQAIEMDPGCCAHLRDELGIPAICSDAPHEALATLPPSNLITMWQVLEHLPDPWATIDAAAANLVPGGRLVIATPNPGSLAFRMLAARWAHLDAPRHLFLIPAAAVIARAAQTGLRPVRLTTADGGEGPHNRVAWQNVLRAHALPLGVRAVGIAAAPFVELVARALAPIERRDMRGSTYTLVLEQVVGR